MCGVSRPAVELDLAESFQFGLDAAQLGAIDNALAFDFEDADLVD
jgi:hypothetical protein